MRSFRLLWIGPASLRLVNFAVKTSVGLMLLMLVSAATAEAFAQNMDQGKEQSKEQTWGDSFVPQVYSVENTGANFAVPIFPTFAKLPIVRPLPDPFVFADGDRRTDFQSWERRRNEIFHAIENTLLGQKPDCHDCTITANYVQNPTNALQGTLTVNVTRNGQTMTETAAVTLPSSGSGPFPYVMGIAGATGSLPASLFTGIASVAFNEDQVTTNGNPKPTDGFYKPYRRTSSVPMAAPIPSIFRSR